MRRIDGNVADPRKWPSATMGSYRLYFRSEGLIVGRDDFEADDDAAAILLAELLYEACSDACDAFELWQGEKWIDTSGNRPSLSSASDVTIMAKMPEVLRQRAEAIRDGEWGISRSRRLSENIARLKEEALRGDPSAEPARARRWRMKAEDLRATADEMKSEMTRVSFQRIAETYETLAEQEERRASGSKALEQARKRQQ